MYMGHNPITVDMATALYMLRQKESMPQGRSWGDSFPRVVNHTTSSVAKRHPDFYAAKHGDFDAAIRLVDALVKDEKVLEVARQHPNAHVAYIHRRQGDGINMIPAAYAAKFAALGMTVEDHRTKWQGHGKEICQVSVPQALACFFEGDSYEDVTRNCISIGGDSDTIAAIAGGIAEAFYGVPEEFGKQVRAYMDKGLLRIVDDFAVWSRERSSTFSLASSAIP